MKKFLLNVFACSAIVSVALVSCRQEDEVISKEDNANLLILNKYRESQKSYSRASNDSTASKKDSIGWYSREVDGDPVPPPKK